MGAVPVQRRKQTQADERVPARRSRGRQRGIVDRDLLLDTAATLFAAKGYRATSLDDIASDLGMKKSSLYHYIASKEEILVDLYDRIYELVEDRIDAIVGEDLEPDDKLRRMVAAYIDSITSHTDMFAMALRNEHELSVEHRTAILRRHRRLERRFETVIREGQEKGLIVDLNPRLLDLAMFGMVLFIQYWYRNTDFDAETITSEFLRLLETGWKSRDGAARKPGAPETLEDALEPTRRLIDKLKE